MLPSSSLVALNVREECLVKTSTLISEKWDFLSAGHALCVRPAGTKIALRSRVCVFV